MSSGDVPGDDETREERRLDLYQDRPTRPLRSSYQAGRRATDLHVNRIATRKTVVVSNVVVVVVYIISEVAPDICYRCIVNL
uniref:Uncharacterized protein n=1 Tax=Leviviridae sp. TaxID=2027243 RepID=A0A514CYY5_9VIRU|nr:MAG: hypothetical protein H2Rhizo31456_000003 [Leviviridae sp.]